MCAVAKGTVLRLLTCQGRCRENLPGGKSRLFRCQAVMAAPSLPRLFRSHSGQVALLLSAPIRQSGDLPRLPPRPAMAALCLYFRPYLSWRRPDSHFRFWPARSVATTLFPVFPGDLQTAPEVDKGKYGGASAPRKSGAQRCEPL